MVLVPRGTAEGLSTHGWSTKEQVKTFLWEHSQVPQTALVKSWLAASVADGRLPQEYVQDPMPISISSKNIMLVVAGGEQSGHAYWMAVGNSGNVISREIKLPSQGKWEALLKEAEENAE